MLRATSYLLSLWLIGFMLPAALHGGSYDQAVEAAAVSLANFLKQERASEVKPQFLGPPEMPNGASAGFTQRLKEHLAPHGIQIGRRASYTFVARLIKNKVERGGFSLRLAGKVLDNSGEDVHEIQSFVDIDNAKDIAELLGITTHFGGMNNDRDRSNRIDQQLRNTTVYLGNNRTLLSSDRVGTYGLNALVGGQTRQFFEPADARGLPFVTLRMGEQYSIKLHNHGSHEVAVDLKIDGVNVFHFMDKKECKEDGSPRYRYWLVSPGSTTEVIGWYKTSRLKSRFKITPQEDSAAALAGLPADDVGQITATYHASWTDDAGRPHDEPKIIRTFAVMRYVKELRYREDGTTYEILKPVYEQRTGTGFGVEVVQQTSGASRTIGIPRAVIAFRYDRPRQ